MTSEDQILELARAAGFDLAALVPLGPPPDAERLRRWIELGRHGGMGWLARDLERLVDPRSWNDVGRTLLVLGLGHAREPVELEGGGRVARYAAGRDYHNVIGRMLTKLARDLARHGFSETTRRVVDAGALLERSHAAEANLGFPSKAANLLHPDHGPWFFLAELVLDRGYDPTHAAPPPGSCGTCTACLDVCPTGALVAPGELDARLCLSYHTIESRDPVPHEQRDHLGAWAFGCDLCSEVCPWGSKAPDRSDAWGTHTAVATGSLLDWLRAPGEGFAERFQGSAVRRAGRDGLARNAAFALAETPIEEARDALLDALNDAAPRVREAAAWTLVRAYGDGAALAAVRAARDAERDPGVASDLTRSLDEGPRPSP
ncbi:MAG: tRNA epoxyqueuosine(34) reductase QueG [Planctomycetota bacterium]